MKLSTIISYSPTQHTILDTYLSTSGAALQLQQQQKIATFTTPLFSDLLWQLA